jgi:hypothetical protein
LKLLFFALVAKNTLTLFVAFSQTEVFGAFDKAPGITRGFLSKHS